MGRSTLTRRDYIELAAVLRNAREDILTKEPQESHCDMLDGCALAAEHVAELCKSRDAKFDVQRFLKNAGVQL